MKQSSIEWLVEQLHNGKELSTVIRKAKEMHKQEIIEAYEEGQNTPYEYSEDNDVNYYDGRNYYKNTYEKEN
jgi:hypothetical protein